MSNFLIKKTSNRIVRAVNYCGICHYCGSPVLLPGEFDAIEIINSPDCWAVVPIDIYECPHCGKSITKMVVYKNLDVSAEFAKL